MVTLKDLRDMRKNDEEANGENASECIESSDNLEKDNDYLAMMLFMFLFGCKNMRTKNCGKIFKMILNIIAASSPKVNCWKK